MKKYILIQNDGEIEANSFELIGASTKRNQKGKIGFFGSGLKYSIAYMMRNNIDFKIFSGEMELRFSVVLEKLKDQEFERICINGKPTSYTTTMGPTWTEDWFVFREIYCNALDENGCQVIKSTENINPVSGKTRIYIELTDKLRFISENWDKYFSFDREPLFVAPQIYTCFLAKKDSGYYSDQDVSVFEKTDGVLYRRGIRVYANSHLLYDYGVVEADINEDRTASQTSALPYMFASLIAGLHNENYVKSILRTGADDNPCKEYNSLHSCTDVTDFSKEWVKFSEENLLILKELSGRYVQEVTSTKKEVFYLPATFARYLKKAVPDVIVLGFGKSVGNSGMNDIAKTPKMDFLIKEVVKSLSEMNYSVPYDISAAQFIDENILGWADIKNERIYLSDQLFDKGRREIALVIMEETEHIKSRAEDCTRNFQNHIFSSWLTSLENSNGLFL